MPAFRLGQSPKRRVGEGARWVAANRGSTGTRPAEAQHCAANARNTLLSLSTGFTPVGATTGSYPRIPHHPSRFPPGSPRWEQQLTATSRRSALQSLRLGLRPKRDEGRGRSGSRQSRLHRHNAGGGQEQASMHKLSETRQTTHPSALNPPFSFSLRGLRFAL